VGSEDDQYNLKTWIRYELSWNEMKLFIFCFIIPIKNTMEIMLLE